MKYFYTNCQLGDLFDGGNGINWQAAGFSAAAIRKDCTQGPDSSGQFISLLPVADEETLTACLSGKALAEGEFAQIISETAAAPIKADILAARQAAREAAALTPTDEDLYRASVIKLLTEIKMNGEGGAGNVSVD